MELVVTRLIYHNYSLADLEYNCAPNILKYPDLEWNEESLKAHPCINDIKECDIVISAMWGEKKEEYAYFFFNRSQLQNCMMYNFIKTIIDGKMPEEYIRQLIEQVIELLNNGNSIRTDRLMYNNYSYPLVKHLLSETISKITENILLRFKAETTGIVPLPDFFNF